MRNVTGGASRGDAIAIFDMSFLFRWVTFDGLGGQDRRAEFATPQFCASASFCAAVAAARNSSTRRCEPFHGVLRCRGEVRPALLPRVRSFGSQPKAPHSQLPDLAIHAARSAGRFRQRKVPERARNPPVLRPEQAKPSLPISLSSAFRFRTTSPANCSLKASPRMAVGVRRDRAPGWRDSANMLLMMYMSPRRVSVRICADSRGGRRAAKVRDGSLRDIPLITSDSGIASPSMSSRDTSDGKSPAEFRPAPMLRLFEADVRNALGVDLHADAGGNKG